MKIDTLNIQYVDRVRFILDLCQSKSVLNLGCADSTRLERTIYAGEHLHLRLQTVASSLVGVDISEESLKTLRRYLPSDSHLICWNVERLNELTLEPFDVVVCGELIEHVSNPGLMLDGIRRLLKDDGILILTTPNSLAVKFFLHALAGNDISSPYHVAQYSPATLRALLQRHGFADAMWAASIWNIPSVQNRIYRLTLGHLLSLPRLRKLLDTLICVARKQLEDS